jgi:hypothetical protein
MSVLDTIYLMKLLNNVTGCLGVMQAIYLSQQILLNMTEQWVFYSYRNWQMYQGKLMSSGWVAFEIHTTRRTLTYTDPTQSQLFRSPLADWLCWVDFENLTFQTTAIKLSGHNLELSNEYLQSTFWLSLRNATVQSHSRWRYAEILGT